MKSVKKYFPLLAFTLAFAALAATPKGSVSERAPELHDPADVRVLEILGADDKAVTIQDTETKKEFKVGREKFGPDFDFRPGYQFAWTAKDLAKAAIPAEKPGAKAKKNK